MAAGLAAGQRAGADRAGGRALAAVGVGAPLAGGPLDVLRNVAGLTGLGLLCAIPLGGGLAWTGPVAYLLVGVYALYTQWHPPALSTPWIWPARPPHDVGAALCAGLVLLAAAGRRHGAWRPGPGRSSEPRRPPDAASRRPILDCRCGPKCTGCWPG